MDLLSWIKVILDSHRTRLSSPTHGSTIASSSEYISGPNLVPYLLQNNGTVGSGLNGPWLLLFHIPNNNK